MFVQAEDGIRDLVRSRGLGDVYKRQVLASATTVKVGDDVLTAKKGIVLATGSRTKGIPPVSYTHLTLPTSDLV